MFYTGPDFYTPAACAQFVEPFILNVHRAPSDFVFRIIRYDSMTCVEWLMPLEGEDWEEIARHADHPTACALALAKIMEGK